MNFSQREPRLIIRIVPTNQPWTQNARHLVVDNTTNVKIVDVHKDNDGIYRCKMSDALNNSSGSASNR